MPSQGPLSPGTAADDASHGPGSNVWANPSNALSSNDSRATYVLAAGNRPSHYLKLTNFGFTVPAGATLDSVVVEIEKAVTGSGSVVDDRVRLVKADGTVGTVDHADTITVWPITSLEAHVVYTFTAADLTTDGIVGTDVNDADFGFVVSANRVTGTSPGANVDHGRVTVNYTEAATGKALTARRRRLNPALWR